MEVRCSSCSATLKAREEHIGRKVRCPKCSAVIEIADADAVMELEEFLDDEPTPPPATRKRSSKQRCPMCGARNPPDADECDACGEELTPVVKNKKKSRGKGGVWRDGKLLVMDKTAELPDRCVKTNGSADHWLRRKLYWHHPAVFLVVLAGLLFYLILALVLRKSADIHIGLSQAALQRRRTAIIVGWLIGFGTIAMIYVGIANYSMTSPEFSMLIIIGSILTGLIGIIVCNQIASCVTAAKIDIEYVWLRGVHPDYLDQLPPWSGDN